MPKITKAEAAHLLDKTGRAVERYAAAGRLSVTYEKGKTRDVPVYDRAEVEALARELRQPSTPARVVVATSSDNHDTGLSEAVAISPSQALQRAGSEQGINTLALLLADALRGAQTQGKAIALPSIADLSHKLMLTEREAAAYSGLSLADIERARGALNAIRTGAGWRVKREEVERYVKKL
jgi:excisionase family DNA binding protein